MEADPGASGSVGTATGQEPMGPGGSGWRGLPRAGTRAAGQADRSGRPQPSPQLYSPKGWAVRFAVYPLLKRARVSPARPWNKGSVGRKSPN